MFSVGDYELNTAEFANVIGKDYVQGIIDNVKKTAGNKLPKNNFNPQNTGMNVPGVRKAHIRTVDGKAQMVGQSILKAGKNTAGALMAGGSAVLGAGKRVGGQALGAGVSYAGRGAEVIAKNPKTSAIAAGAGVLGAGAGYLATRKKRKRR